MHSSVRCVLLISGLAQDPPDSRRPGEAAAMVANIEMRSIFDACLEESARAESARIVGRQKVVLEPGISTLRLY